METAKTKKRSAAAALSKTRLTGAERRRQIVRVAAELFAGRGFGGTTTREIARGAGISEAVIYRHFSRKEDLYRAIIDDRCDDSAGRSRLMGLLEDKTGREVFTVVARFMVEEHQADPAFMRLLSFSALEQRDLSEIFIKTRAIELLGFLEGRIRELMEAGVFKEANPKLSARAFLGMVLHYSYSQELYGLKRYYKHGNEEVIETFVDIFYEGMRRR